MQLTRDAITQAALEILRDYGLADVSMRRIATALGVAPGALYWHIENKQELIADLALSIVAPVTQADPGTRRDPAKLCALLRECVLGVRDGAEVVIAGIGHPEAKVGAALRAVFVEAVEVFGVEGASISKKPAAAHGLIHLTLGAAAVEQSGAQLAAAAGTTAGSGGGRVTDADHATAVNLLLSGLAHVDAEK